MEKAYTEKDNPSRCNLTGCHHIEDLERKDYVDSIENAEYMDVPYDVRAWKETFSGVPTDYLYWDDIKCTYMINNEKGLMFYFEEDSIYHPTDPIDVAETYYRRLIMWENKEYDKLFEAGVPEIFTDVWFSYCVKDMPIKMIYPLYHEIFFKSYAALFGDDAREKPFKLFDTDIQELIKESEKLQ